MLLVEAISSTLLVSVSPGVWPSPDHDGAPISWTLANPAPLGFIGCWLGTV